MNDDPSPETITIVGEALRLAAILDDRVTRPDKERILAWAKKVQKFNLTRDDVLDGVQGFYDSPSERAIQIGDLLHHARIAKRARVDKEEDEVRDRRRCELDAKAEDDIRDFAAEVITGRIEHETPRLLAARDALQNCLGKRESRSAIKEYLAAKVEAMKPAKRGEAREVS